MRIVSFFEVDLQPYGMYVRIGSRDWFFEFQKTKPRNDWFFEFQTPRPRNE